MAACPGNIALRTSDQKKSPLDSRVFRSFALGFVVRSLNAFSLRQITHQLPTSQAASETSGLTGFHSDFNWRKKVTGPTVTDSYAYGASRRQRQERGSDGGKLQGQYERGPTLLLLRGAPEAPLSASSTLTAQWSSPPAGVAELGLPATWPL